MSAFKDSTKYNGTTIYLVFAASMEVPIFRRMVDETHAQRYWRGSSLVCRAAVTTAPTPSASAVLLMMILMLPLLRVPQHQSYE